jgi:starch synthase (maltosyl-transferring)
VLRDELIGEYEIEIGREQRASSAGCREGTMVLSSDEPPLYFLVQDLAQRLASAGRRPWPAEPIPVSLVITDLDVGGAERALVALACGLDRRRWHPQVVCLGPEGALADPLRDAGIAPVCLNVARRRPVRAVLALSRALRSHAPWLIQSFLFHANVAVRLAAPLAGVAWVLSGVRVAEREKRWHLTLDRLTAGLAAGQVCVSAGVLRFCRDVEGINPRRLTVIANGVNADLYERTTPMARTELGLPGDVHVALSIGRLEVQKGLPFLLDAAERVIERRRDWRLIMVGDGPERDWLRRRVDASPLLKGRVHWLGRRDDVPRLLKMADVLVLSSIWEGMPNVVLEAMAAGRAVVATAVEGSEDLVVPGQTGWLVPPRDARALSEVLFDAAVDPSRLGRYGQAGRERVAAGYSLGAMVSAYERLWAGVLGLECSAFHAPNCSSQGPEQADGTEGR